MTPTARSLAHLRKQGGIVAVLEKWIPASPAGFKGPIIRMDLWNFADLIWVKDDAVTLVQTTTGANASARVSKILGNPNARYWITSPNRRILVHAWRKVGDRGKRKLWECRIVTLAISDFK